MCFFEVYVQERDERRAKATHGRRRWRSTSILVVGLLQLELGLVIVVDVATRQQEATSHGLSEFHDVPQEVGLPEQISLELH